MSNCIDLFASSSDESSLFSEHSSDEDFIASDNEPTGDLPDEEQIALDKSIYIASLQSDSPTVYDSDDDLQELSLHNQPKIKQLRTSLLGTKPKNETVA